MESLGKGGVNEASVDELKVLRGVFTQLESIAAGALTDLRYADAEDND
ncbi:MAG: hypothetical protein ABIA93_05185 [Candidatus Woesearchaeota archaeon]